MPFVFASPEIVSTAATDLARIRSAIEEATAAALAPTVQVQAAAADEVSMAISAVFGQHAQSFQALSAQTTAFHGQFVHALSGAGSAYSAAEAFNAGPLQPALDLINAPTQTLLGRPLIGDGANGTAAATRGPASVCRAPAAAVVQEAPAVPPRRLA